MKTLPAALICAIALLPAAHAATLAEKLDAAIADESRPAADRERDENRKPKETLTFFRLQDDFKVIELVPGGGWYTRILAPVLKEKGQLYVALGTKGVEKELLGKPGFEAVKVLPVEMNAKPEGRRFSVGALDLGVTGVDMVLTFRNLHNLTDAGRANLNAAAFAALRPGGYYGVVDHTRRHMAEDTYETWRRMDPVQMIKEIETAGFEFVDYSTLHYRPDDELLYEVGRKTVTGNTDRFTLLFRKPKQ
jgi:predicted methyltransferase